MRLPLLRKIFAPLLCRVIAGAFFLCCAGQIMAEMSLPRGVMDRLYTTYHESQRRYLSETNNLQAALDFSRACFDIAYVISDNSQRADFANQGIAAARRAIAQDAGSAAAHYYLGMNIGQLADAKHGFSGLRMVKDMEREALAARALDEHFDYGGPDRNLGLLYENAPSVISIGSRTKARQHLERALELAPDFPENYLNLIEAYLKWDYRTEAARELEKLEKIWPDAKKKFSGDDWAIDWIDWNQRLGVVRKKLGSNPKVNESPHSTP